MELTKNKLLVLIWFWSLLCIVFTLFITFRTQSQNGFLETLPNIVVIAIWTAIPMLLIIDHFVPAVFWVLTTGGSTTLVLSLIGTFCLVGSKNWKLILLYIFFVLSLIPHIVTVFFMRRFLKSCKKRELLEAEKLRNKVQMEAEKLRNDLEMEAQTEQFLSLLEKQDAERAVLKATLGKSARRGGRR